MCTLIVAVIKLISDSLSPLLDGELCGASTFDCSLSYPHLFIQVRDCLCQVLKLNVEQSRDGVCPHEVCNLVEEYHLT